MLKDICNKLFLGSILIIVSACTIVKKEERYNMHALVSINDKYGVIDEKQNWVVKPEYSEKELKVLDRICILREDTLVVMNGTEKVFELTNVRNLYYDNKGEPIIVLRKISDEKNKKSNFFVLDSYQFEVYDLNGKLLFNDSVNTWHASFSEGLSSFALSSEAVLNIEKAIPFPGGKEKWGVMDSSGNVVVAPAYEEVKPFNNGMASVRLEGKWGYLNSTGKLAIPALYEYAMSWNGKYGLVQKNQLWCIIDSSGVEKLKCGFPYLEWGHTPFVLVADKGEFIPGEYPLIDLFAGNDFRVFDLEKNTFLSFKANWIKYLGEKRYVASFDGKDVVLLNESFEKISKESFESIGSFKNGLAPAAVKGLFGYIDLNGNWFISPEFTSAGNFY